MFTALADPTRLRIVEMLAASGQLPVSDISKKFDISAPAISQHLKVLREAKLVEVEIKAQQRIYTLNPSGMSEAERWIGKIRKMWESRLDRLDQFLLEEVKKSTKGQRKKQ